MEVTASTKKTLCAAFGLPMSRLIYLVEVDFVPLVRYQLFGPNRVRPEKARKRKPCIL